MGDVSRVSFQLAGDILRIVFAWIRSLCIPANSSLGPICNAVQFLKQGDKCF